MWTESQTRQKPKDRVRLKVSVSRNRKKQKAAEDWPHSKTQAWTQAQRVSEGFGVRPVLSAPYTHFQSQRDCVLQPRVASLRATLGKRPRRPSTLKGLWPDLPHPDLPPDPTL